MKGGEVEGRWRGGGGEVGGRWRGGGGEVEGSWRGGGGEVEGRGRGGGGNKTCYSHTCNPHIDTNCVHPFIEDDGDSVEDAEIFDMVFLSDERCLFSQRPAST